VLFHTNTLGKMLFNRIPLISFDTIKKNFHHPYYIQPRRVKCVHLKQNINESFNESNFYEKDNKKLKNSVNRIKNKKVK